MKQQGAPSSVFQKGWEGDCEQSCGLLGEKELLSRRERGPIPVSALKFPAES